MRPTPHSFTRDAARRIVRAVRSVEASMPPRLGLQRPRKRAGDSEATESLDLDLDFLASTEVVEGELRINVEGGWVVVDPLGGKLVEGGYVGTTVSGSLTIFLSVDRETLAVGFAVGPSDEFGYDADHLLVPICSCTVEKDSETGEYVVETLRQHHVGALYVGTQI